jgi:hypothetical protein
MEELGRRSTYLHLVARSGGTGEALTGSSHHVAGSGGGGGAPGGAGHLVTGSGGAGNPVAGARVTGAAPAGTSYVHVAGYAGAGWAPGGAVHLAAEAREGGATRGAEAGMAFVAAP